jgi:hypothetical protein
VCSRSAPPQASVTNDSTGWLCCHFSVDVVLDGADDLAGNDIFSCVLFSSHLITKLAVIAEACCDDIILCVPEENFLSNATHLASLKGACDISD